MATYRRDKLFRLAQAGRLMMIRTARDLQPGEAAELPVRVGAVGDWRDGWCNVRADHFEGKSGRAYHGRADGTITLIVHSNLSYDFRVLPEGQTAQPLPPPPAPEPAPPLPPPQPTRFTEPFVAEVGQHVLASFAKLNKRCTLAEYREQCRYSWDWRAEVCKVEAIHTFDPAEYDRFAEALMDPAGWLPEGGTDSDADLRADWTLETSTPEELAAYRAQAYELVTVVQAPGRETFVVNAHGYGYARYVGLDPVPVLRGTAEVG